MRSKKAPPLRSNFPVVGIGASAGGLAAFTQLLSSIPPTAAWRSCSSSTSIRRTRSFLGEALAKATRCRSTPGRGRHAGRAQPRLRHPAQRGPRHFDGDSLTLLPRDDEARKPHLPIDLFFRALAAERGSQAIGVVLSGDRVRRHRGPAGDQGGERHHLRAGSADRRSSTACRTARSTPASSTTRCRIPALAAGAGAAEPPPVRRRARCEREAGDRRRARSRRSSPSCATPIGRRLQRVQAGHASSGALARRMALRQVDDLQELPALLADATRRDPRPLRRHPHSRHLVLPRPGRLRDARSRSVFPEILKAKADGRADPRVGGRLLDGRGGLLARHRAAGAPWRGTHSRTRSRSSDPTSARQAIEKARLGVFSDSAMRDVSDERRRRYFTKVERGYRINKRVRDLCVFVRHDLARDPPFSQARPGELPQRAHLLRSQPLQKRVLPTFHYCLNQPASCCSAAPRTSRASPAVLAGRQGEQDLRAHGGRAARSSSRRAGGHPALPQSRRRAGADATRRGAPSTSVKHLDRCCSPAMRRRACSSTRSWRSSSFAGDTGAYLQPAPGEPQTNLLKMAREGLLAALRATHRRRPRSRMAPVHRHGRRGRRGRRRRRPLRHRGGPVHRAARRQGARSSSVIFEESRRRRSAGAARRAHAVEAGRTTGRRRPKLEHELAATKEYLQSLIEEHGRTNDELGAANEELSRATKSSRA